MSTTKRTAEDVPFEARMEELEARSRHSSVRRASGETDALVVGDWVIIDDLYSGPVISEEPDPDFPDIQAIMIRISADKGRGYWTGEDQHNSGWFRADLHDIKWVGTSQRDDDYRYATNRTAAIEAAEDVPFEEDLLTELAEKVYDIVNTYIESHEGLALLVSQAELQGLAADFVTKAVEGGVVDVDYELKQKMKWAVQKFERAKRGGGGTPRQYAVALVNAVYDYVAQQNPNLDDEELNRKIIEEIENLGIDYDEVNKIVESIY